MRYPGTIASRHATSTATAVFAASIARDRHALAPYTAHSAPHAPAAGAAHTRAARTHARTPRLRGRAPPPPPPPVIGICIPPSPPPPPRAAGAGAAASGRSVTSKDMGLRGAPAAAAPGAPRWQMSSMCQDDR